MQHLLRWSFSRREKPAAERSARRRKLVCANEHSRHNVPAPQADMVAARPTPTILGVRTIPRKILGASAPDCG